MDKSFSPASVVAGQTSTLTFTVTNTSELNAKTGWTFTDVLPTGLTIADNAASTTCLNASLTAASGTGTVQMTGDLAQGMASCTVTVHVTSATAATYTNGPGNVTTSGLNPPGTSPVTFVPQSPSLSIVKNAAPASVAKAGDKITYTFAVTNTGNVPLTNIQVADTLTAPAGPELTVTCPPGPLAPGITITCTANQYTVTQADADHGSVADSATATGTPPSGPAVTSPPSTANVPVPTGPALAVVKTATPSTANKAGDTVVYKFAVTNTGNVTLSNISVADILNPPAGPPLVITCPPGPLAPGATLTCTAAPYTLTQADVNNSRVDNSATATGTPPTGPPVTSPPSGQVVTVPPGPSISLTKTAAPTVVHKAGDTVVYSFTVTNTGNVTLSNVSATDALNPPSGPELTVTCPPEPLAPGASATCTSNPYTLTQADVNNTQVTNSATATGTPPGGPAIGTPPVPYVLPVPPADSITVVKTADVPVTHKAGDPIHYSYLVTNTGNQDLHNVTVTDTFTPPAGPPVTVTCPVNTLAPGASQTCTATVYTDSQADVDNGKVDNAAVAIGISPSGTPVVSNPSAVDVPVQAGAAMTVTKSAGVSKAKVGDVIRYTYLVTNTGNETLTNIKVTDVFAAPAGPAVTVTCPTSTLAPGTFETCTSSPYTVTEADQRTGKVSNTAVATGTTPGGEPYSSTAGKATVTITGEYYGRPPTEEELPSTGFSGIGLLWAAAGTALAGTGLIAKTTRRRQRV